MYETDMKYQGQHLILLSPREKVSPIHVQVNIISLVPKGLCIAQSLIDKYKFAVYTLPLVISAPPAGLQLAAGCLNCLIRVGVTSVHYRSGNGHEIEP